MIQGGFLVQWQTKTLTGSLLGMAGQQQPWRFRRIMRLTLPFFKFSFCTFYHQYYGITRRFFFHVSRLWKITVCTSSYWLAGSRHHQILWHRLELGNITMCPSGAHSWWTVSPNREGPTVHSASTYIDAIHDTYLSTTLTTFMLYTFSLCIQPFHDMTLCKERMKKIFISILLFFLLLLLLLLVTSVYRQARVI